MYVSQPAQNTKNHLKAISHESNIETVTQTCTFVNLHRTLRTT